MTLLTKARNVFHRCTKKLGLKVQRLSANQVRGLDPLADLEFLLGGTKRPVIFDVGANDGETTAALLARFPDAQLFAFEPFKDCAEKLAARYAENPNVRIETLALGEKPKSALLNLYSGDRMNSLLELNSAPEGQMSGFHSIGTAPTVVDSLDCFCSRNELQQIHILKIDTQGYDLNVLKGATGLLQEKRIRAIHLEINFVPMYAHQASFSDIHMFLSSHNYRLVGLYNQVWKDGCIAWCDACYILPL